MSDADVKARLDWRMPPLKQVTVLGHRMAYYEAGPKGQGVPVIFCHGFPELAFSWRHQLKAFDKAGRWAIAPDQRGYGLTDRPGPVEAYDMEHLTGDLVALIDHLGFDDVRLVGQSMGGWTMLEYALVHTDTVKALVLSSTSGTLDRRGFFALGAS